MEEENKEFKEEERVSSMKAVARYSGLGIQMLAPILGGALGGNWLDKHYQFETPVFTIVLTLLGIGLAFYVVIKELSEK